MKYQVPIKCKSHQDYARPKASVVVAALGLLVAGTMSASAGMVTGSVVAPPMSSASSPINISAGTLDWAVYGEQAFVSGGGNGTSENTMAGGPDSISALTTNPGYQIFSTWNALPVYMTYSGGSTYSTPSAAIAGYNYTQAFSYSDYNHMNSYLSFTQTLLAPEENINVYLTGFYTSFDINATLSSGGSFIDDNVPLPLNDTQASQKPGDNHSSGVVDLTVLGNVGDVVTFAVTQDQTTSDTYYSNVGINAVSVYAVPEPTTTALLFTGLALVGGFLKRRAS